MKKFLCGVYMGASMIFIWGMFIELNRLSEEINEHRTKAML